MRIILKCLPVPIYRLRDHNNAQSTIGMLGCWLAWWEPDRHTTISRSDKSGGFGDKRLDKTEGNDSSCHQLCLFIFHLFWYQLFSTLTVENSIGNDHMPREFQRLHSIHYQITYTRTQPSKRWQRNLNIITAWMHLYAHINPLYSPNRYVGPDLQANT